jgi:hypothetical protein
MWKNGVFFWVLKLLKWRCLGALGGCFLLIDQILSAIAYARDDTQAAGCRVKLLDMGFSTPFTPAGGDNILRILAKKTNGWYENLSRTKIWSASPDAFTEKRQEKKGQEPNEILNPFFES